MKKRVNFVAVLVFGVLFLTMVSAVTITGTINDLTADVKLTAVDGATAGVDGYDMVAPDSPSGYTQFSSTVSGTDLSIDARPTTIREADLVYSASAAQTGDLDLSWDSVGSGVTASLVYYGTDSSYTTSQSTTDMGAASSTSVDLSSDTDIYFRVVLQASCGDGVCASGESCSTCSADCGSCPLTTGEDGGGGGGGAVVSGNLIVSPEDFNIPIAINSVKTKHLTVSNTGNSSQSVSISVTGLEEMIEFKENSFVLEPNKEKTVSFRVIAPEEPGIYGGKFIVGGQTVFVSLAVGSKDLLFDASVVIPDNFKIIDMGTKLGSQITLIPMGEDPRLDVTLKYSIKDFEGKTFVTESETILVEGQKTFRKEFSTETLPTGKYILGLELIYPNGVATSTSHFAIRGERSLISDYRYILISLAIAVIILIILVVFVLRGRNKLKSRRR